MTIYTTIPILPSGINNAGQIVTSSGIWRDGTLTPVFKPGSDDTTSIGINNQGQVVGSYEFHGSPGTITVQGFLYSNGTYTAVSNSSILNDINDLGQIVGTWGNQGYLYSGGSSTPISDPLANPFFGTTPTGINNAGQIVGSYVDSAHTSHGFLYDPSTGITPRSMIRSAPGVPRPRASTTPGRSSDISPTSTAAFMVSSIPPAS